MTHQMIIPVPEDFSFTENLEYLSRSADECMFHIKEGKLSRAIEAGDEPVVFEMEDHQDGISVRLNMNGKPGAEEQAAVSGFIRDWLDLERDLGPFYEMAERAPLLRDAVSRHRGLRVVGIPDLFETFVWAILGQQITVAFAYVLKRRFVETFGQAIESDGVTHYLFPSAEKVAALKPDALRELKITARKSEYIIGVARLITDGELTKDGLLALGDDRLIEHRLTAIRGIGPWTANYVLMRCLRSPDAYPAADVGLHNALKLVAGLDRKPTLPEVEAFAEPWQGWRAYATFYLWRFLSSEAEQG
ncbi:DNA-3-methyladenine glycosylase II [Bhargavaea ginsengi]|uniref:DNA-3-methyladenine glycosylase II n=1 Tax=Bhargavaea ginsengi TaxID=426757 RepID=A0A1H6TTV9_9BACL|nr:DNA-3-methyladenine glycosylase [Bhargavaea ginsengi]SEI83461.1 DNA-3-methyladenine glycosylase II [Bhargavaea ginsengi]